MFGADPYKVGCVGSHQSGTLIGQNRKNIYFSNNGTTNVCPKMMVDKLGHFLNYSNKIKISERVEEIGCPVLFSRFLFEQPIIWAPYVCTKFCPLNYFF